MLVAEVPSPEQQRMEPNLPAQPGNPGGGRRRGRRGGRGRSRSPRLSTQTAQAGLPANTPTEETTAPEPKVPAATHGEKDSFAIRQAVGEVRQIVESLEQALEQMEEVLQLVEVAERQKITDEQEIESLRRALRKIQQPRSGHQERPRSNG
jgi:exonuclease VII small subunit